MNVSGFLRYTSLMLVGLMAGSSFAFVLGMGPAMEKLSAAAYIELHQNLDPAFTAWNPFLYFLVTLIIAANLYLIRHDWKSLEFLLVLFALICVLDELLMTWTGNLPLNRAVHSWQMLAPPSDWVEVRSQWLRFMYIRCALLVSGFGLLLASSFFMKRSLSSQPSVFVVSSEWQRSPL
ncbi:anthrone oxygenase family protein [Bdellovibrio sp. HCB117]|uniref:anthrone oxygenase family protein n=1 Tax=Bdellovibrio sp. HCB117 TaxID=3394359 RepID=UPI0039B604FE